MECMVGTKPGMPLSISIVCSRSTPHAAYHVDVVRIGLLGQFGSVCLTGPSRLVAHGIDMSPTELASSPAESTIPREATLRSSPFTPC